MAGVSGNTNINNNLLNTITNNNSNVNVNHSNATIEMSVATARNSGTLLTTGTPTTSGLSIAPTLVTSSLTNSGLGVMIPASIKAITSNSNSAASPITRNTGGIIVTSTGMPNNITSGIPVISSSVVMNPINNSINPVYTSGGIGSNISVSNINTYGANLTSIYTSSNLNTSGSVTLNHYGATAVSNCDNASNNTSSNNTANISVEDGIETANGSADKREMLALLKLVKRFNLKQTEELLCKEANLRLDEAEKLNDQDVALMLSSTLNDAGDILLNRATSGCSTASGTIGNIISGSTTDNSIVNAKFHNYAKLYDNAFQELRNFVDESLDIYKHELFMVLYPILVQVYFKLIKNGYPKAARSFVEKYGPELDYYYRDDLRKLLLITKRSDLENNDFMSTTNSDKFILRMSRDAYSLFKRHIQDQKQELLADIVQKYLHFDTYEGTARSKKLCNITSGSLIGEARRSDNKIRVYYGLLKEIDFQTLTNPASILEDEEDIDADAPDRPKKKKPRKDPLFTKKTKSDPNAPAIDRIPLPELKDADKLEKLKALREATKRVILNKDSLPSVCIYTILNAHYQVCCAEISEDSSMMAVGFTDSIIKIWSLTPNKLREMKPTDQLQDIDKEADDVLVRMMDDRNGEMSRCFYGHSGPVFRCTFSPEKNMLLSCSEDTSIRLWSLQTWTCIVVYKGHLFPVWDIRFSPHGYYFASCSFDRTIRLWSTDSNQPLRIFVGHLSDVDCIQFHPNSNYIASGSSDRTVRLWDVLNGQLVRLMTGHKGAIYSLAFSICGRYLASGSSDHCILIWDLSHGQLVVPLQHHSATIHTLSFSRDGNILSAGGMDCLLTLWDFTKLTEDYLAQQPASSRNPKMKNGDSYLLRSFPTKSTPFLSLHFTRRNLLLAVGFFKS